MKEAERIARRSVLDRLIEPGEHDFRSQAESIRAVKAAVLRDVEWLLNTRRIADPAPPEFVELNNSVYHYGLPDLSSLSASSQSIQGEALRRIEQCIEQFEPRLTGIRVTAIESRFSDENDRKSDRSFRFHIEAVLRVDQMEPVVFDTVLDALNGRFDVREQP